MFADSSQNRNVLEFDSWEGRCCDYRGVICRQIPILHNKQRRPSEFYLGIASDPIARVTSIKPANKNDTSPFYLAQSKGGIFKQLVRNVFHLLLVSYTKAVGRFFRCRMVRFFVRYTQNGVGGIPILCIEIPNQFSAPQDIYDPEKT